jgi:hypothetical protein
VELIMFFDKNGKEIKDGMTLNGGKDYTKLYGYPKFRIGDYIDKYLIDLEDNSNKGVELYGIYLEFENGECRGINSRFLKKFEIVGG